MLVTWAAHVCIATAHARAHAHVGCALSSSWCTHRGRVPEPCQAHSCHACMSQAACPWLRILPTPAVSPHSNLLLLTPTTNSRGSTASHTCSRSCGQQSAQVLCKATTREHAGASAQRALGSWGIEEHLCFDACTEDRQHTTSHPNKTHCTAPPPLASPLPQARMWRRSAAPGSAQH
jgi:hypothetical protein